MNQDHKSHRNYNASENDQSNNADSGQAKSNENSTNHKHKKQKLNMAKLASGLRHYFVKVIVDNNVKIKCITCGKTYSISTETGDS